MNSMACRSSLEMMLDKIQELEDQPKDEPPALPVRPASRARLPRAKNPLLLDFQIKDSEWVAEKNGNITGYSASISGHSQDIGILLKGVTGAPVEKRVVSIQKCYRGHHLRRVYKDVQTGVVSLQSFARGENARREYQYRSKRLKAVTLIQEHARNYIERRRLQSNARIHEPNSRENTTPRRNGNDQGLEAHMKVPYRFVIDLHKLVLRTEAKVREKKRENADLKIKLQEMDEKWQKSEERMKSMEKAWQDQLTYIQKCLAASKKKSSSPVIKLAQFDSMEEYFNQNRDTNAVRIPKEEHMNLDEDCVKQVAYTLHRDEELRNLKVRFKAWKKEYINKLREAQSSFRKLDNAENRKRQKNWWGRFSSH